MLYVFFGPDSFTRHEALQGLKAGLDEDGALPTNTAALDGRQTTPEEVMAACSTVPFLGVNRLVIVDGLLGSLSGGGRKGRKKAAPAEASDLGRWGALVDYLPSMPGSTTLVFLDGGLRSEPPLLEALTRRGEVRRFPALAGKDLPGWLQRRARAKGLQIDSRAASLIAELMGDQRRPRADGEYNDLWALANELDKLAAAAADGAITEALVRELSPHLREQKGFFLWDALIECRPNQATRLLHELQAQGDNAQATLGNIAAGYRRLSVARGLLDEGESTAAIARAFNFKSQFPAEKLADQAANYPIERLRAVFRRIVEADFDQKSGLCDEELTLELLVQDLSAAGNRR
jgi:DNA polymerase-3 subunit delta